jgi:hypothetical protein
MWSAAQGQGHQDSKNGGALSYGRTCREENGREVQREFNLADFLPSADLLTNVAQKGFVFNLILCGNCGKLFFISFFLMIRPLILPVYLPMDTMPRAQGLYSTLSSHVVCSATPASSWVVRRKHWTNIYLWLVSQHQRLAGKSTLIEEKLAYSFFM